MTMFHLRNLDNLRVILYQPLLITDYEMKGLVFNIFHIEDCYFNSKCL